MRSRAYAAVEERPRVCDPSLSVPDAEIKCCTPPILFVLQVCLRLESRLMAIPIDGQL